MAEEIIHFAKSFSNDEAKSWVSKHLTNLNLKTKFEERNGIVFMKISGEQSELNTFLDRISGFRNGEILSH